MKNKLEVLGNIYCAGVYGMRLRDRKEYLYIGSSIEINDAMSRHLHFLKRGQYADTNKAVLQDYYDMGELVFEVIKESSHDKVTEMSLEQKENLQIALSVLEQFYIGLYIDTVCNKQKSVSKHSSSTSVDTTEKRRNMNIGSNNPNAKHEEKIIAEILWLKLNGYKPRQIAEYYHDVRKQYISQIGITKWIYLEPIKPDWIDVA